MNFRAEIVEAFATALLVFIGVGAVVLNAETLLLGPVGVAATFGVTVAVLIWAFGGQSGAHINPAVTVALAAVGRFPWKRVPTYVLAQCAGAAAGAWVVHRTIGDVAHGMTDLPGTTMARGIILEATLTALLLAAMIGTAFDRRGDTRMMPLAAGGTIFVASLLAGPLTGGGFNPARSFGPALVAGDLDLMPMFTLAPLFGALVGAALVTWAGRAVVPGSDEEALQHSDPIRDALRERRL